MRSSPLILATFLAVLWPLSDARALDSGWKSADHVQLQLLTATDAAGKADAIEGALEIKLEDGWHAYWRMAGDGGLAPTFDWKDSKNVSDVAVDWPLATRFETAGLQSFGYAGSYTLPLKAKLAKPGEAATISLKAEIMVCNDICVPQTLAADLPVPAGDAKASAETALLDKAKKEVPAKGDTPALKIESAVVGPDAVVVQAWAARGFEGADLYAEPAELVLFASPEITADKKDPRRATLRIPKGMKDSNLAKDVMGKTLVLTLKTKDGAIEKSFPF